MATFFVSCSRFFMLVAVLLLIAAPIATNAYNCDSDCSSERCVKVLGYKKCTTFNDLVCQIGKQADCAAIRLREERARVAEAAKAAADRAAAIAKATRDRLAAEAKAAAARAAAAVKAAAARAAAEAKAAADRAAAALKAIRDRAAASLAAIGSKLEALRSSQQKKLTAAISTANQRVGASVVHMRQQLLALPMAAAETANTALINKKNQLQERFRAVVDSQIDSIIEQIKTEAIDALYTSNPLLMGARMAVLVRQIARAVGNLVIVRANINELADIGKSPLDVAVKSMPARVPTLLDSIQKNVNNALNPLKEPALNVQTLVEPAHDALNAVLTLLRECVDSINTSVTEANGYYAEARGTVNAEQLTITNLNKQGDAIIQQQLTNLKKTIEEEITNRLEDIAGPFLTGLVASALL